MDEYRCVICDQITTEHGPYRPEDCICRRCSEEGDWVENLRPENTHRRLMYIGILIASLIFAGHIVVFLLS